MTRRLISLVAMTAGAVALVSCGKAQVAANAPLSADPDLICASALVVAGGAARTAGDAATEAKIVNRLHYSLGRLSARRPDERWNSAWQEEVGGVKPGAVSSKLEMANDCMSRMTRDFADH